MLVMNIKLASLLLVSVICKNLQKKRAIQNPENRVVNGVNARFGQAPWILYSEFCHDDFGCFLCGSTIIGKKTILSAAHCLILDSDDTLVTKSYFWHNTLIVLESQLGPDYTSENFLVHPEYTYYGYNYDIALILLNYNIKIDTIAKLPNSNPQTGTFYDIFGWGDKAEDIEESNIGSTYMLQHGQVYQLSYNDCTKDKDYKKEVDKDSTICAADYAKGVDACLGDSGGPLSVEDTVYGITSWGIGCGRQGLPGVYTNVFYYKEWIIDSSMDKSILENKVIGSEEDLEKIKLEIKYDFKKIGKKIKKIVKDL